MCGIVGIYLKSEKFESSLGKMLSGMLVNMGSRGPDSAGFAIYKKEDDGEYKYSLCLNNLSFEKFKNELQNKISFSDIEENSDHVIVKSKDNPKKVLEIITRVFKEVSIVGYGKSIEIFKQVGEPKDVVKSLILKVLAVLMVLATLEWLLKVQLLLTVHTPTLLVKMNVWFIMDHYLIIII